MIYAEGMGPRDFATLLVAALKSWQIDQANAHERIRDSVEYLESSVECDAVCQSRLRMIKKLYDRMNQDPKNDEHRESALAEAEKLQDQFNS